MQRLVQSIPVMARLLKRTAPPSETARIPLTETVLRQAVRLAIAARCRQKGN